jgi:peptide deformylase
MEIIKFPDKTLLKKAKRVDKIDDIIRNIASNMIEAMLENSGVGLSGNQVGLLKRIIIVMHNDEPKVMINPEIIFTSDEKMGIREGCLSFPDEYYDIERPKTITVKYRNLSGHPILETHTDLTARIILHEIDHLDGIVFTEKVQLLNTPSPEDTLTTV